MEPPVQEQAEVEPSEPEPLDEAIEAPSEEAPSDEVLASTLPAPLNSPTPTIAPPSGPRSTWVELDTMTGMGIHVAGHSRRDLRPLRDLDFETSWSMETEEGVYPAIELNLHEAVRVGAISFTIGDTRVVGGVDKFVERRRIRAFEVRHGTDVQTFRTDLDDRGMQDFVMRGDGGDWTIQVTEWEDGTGTDEALVISELRVLGEIGEADYDPHAPGMADFVVADELRAQLFERLRVYRRALGSSLSPQTDRSVHGKAEVLQTALHASSSPVLILPAGRCYVIVGSVTRRVGGTTRRRVRFQGINAPESWEPPPQYPRDASRFVLGLENPICAGDEDIEARLRFDGDAIRTQFGVFDQRNNGEANAAP